MAASFGQLVKEQRIEMGLTQQRLADLVGRSPSTIRSWERDRATPNDEVVITSLADVLGIEAVILSELAGVEFSELASDGTASAEVAEAIGSGPSVSQEPPLDHPAAVEREPHTEVDSSSDDIPVSMDELVTSDDPVPTNAPLSRPSSDWGPEPVVRTSALFDELRTARPVKAPEPAKPYVLRTERRESSLGPERPEGGDTLFGDEPPDPQEPPADWNAEIDLDELQDPIEGRQEPTNVNAVDRDKETADRPSSTPLETALADAVADFDVEPTWDDEATQVLMVSAPAEERLLGVATATAVEFVAEPRPHTEPTPHVGLDSDATEVISRAPAVEPFPTAEAVPQATTPVAAVRPVVRGTQQRTQTMESGRPIGPNSYLEDPHEIRGYRIRAGLTAAALIAMFIVARWAWSGFREQLGGILDTLTTGF